MKYISAFSGIEAASVAWRPLGWEPVAFSEIDPFPSAVLAERYPGVPNLGDITKVDWKRWRGKCDLVVGGSPCQSFSVAGKREGLKGESKLMYEYVRAIREVRPRWLVWENVPGALSSEGGEAFRCLLSELDKLGYGMAWRVLDAQFFGVAQRRRRVFLVGRLGEQPPACVLFEPDCLRGDFASSKQKRQELAAAAGRGASCAGFKAGAGAAAGGIGWEAEASPTVTAGDSGTNRAPAVAIQGSMIGRAEANGPQGCGYETDGACFTLNCTDRHAVAFAQNSRDEVRIQGDGTLSGALSANPGMKQTTYVCEGANIQPSVLCGDTIGALCARDFKGVGNQYVSEGKVIATTVRERRMAVRRLTPRECERLQGFEDDWTRIPYRGRPAEECPDGPRYKAIGNSMAVNVMRWIGERIAMCERGEIR